MFLHQSPDQHAFTPDIRLEDVLVCVESAIENALVFNTPLWILSMDLRKAFDTVEHQALFQALQDHNIPDAYVELLQRLYHNQTGSVHDSAHSNIKRGVRQDDVLSSILFNCVIDIVFENWKRQLHHEGLLIDNNIPRLTNRACF